MIATFESCFTFQTERSQRLKMEVPSWNVHFSTLRPSTDTLEKFKTVHYDIFEPSTFILPLFWTVFYRP